MDRADRDCYDCAPAERLDRSFVSSLLPVISLLLRLRSAWWSKMRSRRGTCAGKFRDNNDNSNENHNDNDNHNDENCGQKDQLILVRCLRFSIYHTILNIILVLGSDCLRSGVVEARGSKHVVRCRYSLNKQTLHIVYTFYRIAKTAVERFRYRFCGKTIT